MAIRDYFRSYFCKLAELQARSDIIEALEAQPEPVQSLVPAAGCGVENVNREFQPAGNPDGEIIQELKERCENELTAWKSCDPPDTQWGVVALRQIIDEYEIMLRILESRGAA